LRKNKGLPYRRLNVPVGCLKRALASLHVKESSDITNFGGKEPGAV